VTVSASTGSSAIASIVRRGYGSSQPNLKM
jgi:hypothetical protein